MTLLVDRSAARVLLVDAQQRLLLLKWVHAAEPERGSWWITPGGGLDPGESFEAGAVRELFEETGLRVDVTQLGRSVLERDIETELSGVRYRQHERFFRVHVDAHAVDTSGFTELEVASVTEHRWWTRDELAATTERLSPRNVLELLT